MKKVLVVGGGIGGLTAALALSRRGARVSVWEREPAFSPIGAGIVLAPNAIAILERLGVDAARRGACVGAMLLQSADGRALQRMDLSAWRDSHGPAYAFHRGELHEALLEALPAEVEIRCAAAPVLAEADDGVTATPPQGGSERFDLIVGADGIHSQVRALAGHAVPVRYSGYTCWRTVCPNPGVRDSLETWGRGARFGAVPLSRGRLYVFLVKNAPRRASSLAWPDGFRATFGAFAAPCPAVLEAMEGATLMHHDLEELDEPAWGRGRTWLLGDAAHAMTPNLGQGAAMAIEDAFVLAGCVDGDLEAGHRRYVATRHPRVRRVQLDSRRFGRIAHCASPPAVWARDTLVRLLPQSMADRQYLQVVGPGLELARAS